MTKAPLDEAALVQPVNEAINRKIPVVIFDSGLKGDNYVSFVATDNLKGGKMGGERLAQGGGRDVRGHDHQAVHPAAHRLQHVDHLRRVAVGARDQAVVPGAARCHIDAANELGKEFAVHVG